MESRETPTTIRSRMLKELRQKEPLCMNAPYTVICRPDTSESDAKKNQTLLCLGLFYEGRHICILRHSVSTEAQNRDLFGQCELTLMSQLDVTRKM